MALIKKLVALDDWVQIYAIARRDLPIDSKKITRIHLDLNSKQEIQEKLKGANAKSVTNVFHLAFGGKMLAVTSRSQHKRDSAISKQPMAILRACCLYESCAVQGTYQAGA